MANLTYEIQFTPQPGSLGSLIEYRENGTSTWNTPGAPANPTTLTSYTLSLEKGKSYTVRVSSVGGKCSAKYRYLSITVPNTGACCPAGYSLSPDETYCYKEEVVAPTISQSNVCVAASNLPTVYSGSGTKLYAAGYGAHLNGTQTHTLLSTTYWKEGSGTITGPMNREGIWIDADCDGNKDALASGAVLQFSYVINSPTAKTVYVGLGGDNTFALQVNGSTVVDCNTTAGQYAGGSINDNFNYWHIIPVNIPAGPVLFTFKAIGDGSVNDAFAAVIYDNTATQIQVATSDTDLNILFQTSDFIGGHIDVATCADGYTLDTSGGVGSYACRKLITTSTTSC